MTTISNLKEHAYRHIRRKLARPTLVPKGGWSDRVLAQELGISRTPVREAMRQLEFEGLVEQRARSGTFPRRLGLRDWLDMLDVRELLEGFAAFHAASHATPGQVRKLERHCERLLAVCEEMTSGERSRTEAELVDGVDECDLGFHRGLAHASGNAWVLKMVDTCQLLSRSFQPLPGVVLPVDASLRRRWLETHSQHVAVVEAIRRHDAVGAQAAIHHHLRVGRKYHVADARRARLPRAATPRGQAVDEAGIGTLTPES